MKRIVINSVLIIVLSVLAWACWIAEVMYVDGWEGIRWLRSFQVASIPCTLLIVITYLSPFVFSQRKVPLRNLFTAITLLFSASFLCFYLGRFFFYGLRPWGYLLFAPLFVKVLIVVLLVCAVILHGVLYWYITAKIFRKIHPLNILISVFAVPVAVFVAGLFCQFFPGFGTGDDFVDTIKMGYLVFWVCLFFGISGWIFSLQKEKIIA
jgi:hypothetical protein